MDNSSEANPIDWYNAYLEVDFQLVQLANGAGITAGANGGDQDATTTNGNTFIKEIQVECNGISVYTNMRANESSNALTLLKYTKSYADSVGRDQFFYVDTSTGTTEGRQAEALYNGGFAKRKILTDAAAVNKISIPLNQYSYFAAFKISFTPISKQTFLSNWKMTQISFSEMLLHQTQKSSDKVAIMVPKNHFQWFGDERVH